MKAFGTRMRGGVATLLSAALIVSGALLAAPAASAEEPVAAAPVVETVATEAPALEAPAAEAPAGDAAGSQPEATAESPAAPEADSSAAAEQAAPALAAPTVAEILSAPASALPGALEGVRSGGGALDWGFKASWRSYLTSSFTKGTQQVYGGAVANQDGTVHYPESTESNYDPATGVGVIAYTGGVQWQSEAHGFTIVMQNPRITIAADGSAAVSAETSTSDTAGSASVERVIVATLSNAGVPGEGEEMLTWSGVSGVFASMLAPGGVARYAGQATDPFSFSTPAAAPVVTPVWEPAISVALADGTPLAAGAKVYKDDVIVVRGSGFDPLSHPRPVTGRPPVTAGDPTGNYVVFGNFAEAWRPSSGAASSARVIGDQRWAMTDATFGNIAPSYLSVVRAQRVALGADGAFTAELTAKAATSAPGSYGVFTYVAGGGANEAAQELELRLDYVDSVRPAEPTKPAVKVAAVNVDGQQGLKVDVNATSLPGNIYAALIERGTAANIDMSKPDSYAAFALPFPKVTDGVANFSLIASIDKLDRKKQYEVLVWKQHSMPIAENVYGLADVTITEEQWDKLQGITHPVVPPTKPQPTAPGAGSLTWGVSSSFANYVTGTIAKGSISTSGVGGGRGGYVFPQATGSSWNAETRTGTVRYSGTVTFTGHSGLLSETFANPVITVSSPASGTISAGGQSFSLNLASAGFAVNSDGSVTWSGVSVGGGISGGDGAGAGGSLGMDSLSFTVGSASGMSFGSTSTVSPFAKARTAAEKAPASTGLTVVTPGAKLVPGGEIEITASGFQPNEQGILVVMYSEPTVLDTNAKADKNGVVRWIGTLPKDLAGKHTITLQGSINVGQEITIAKAAEVKKKATTAVAAETTAPVVQAAEGSDASGLPAWVWWTGALALLVIAGTGTALVVAQRRRVDAPTHL